MLGFILHYFPSAGGTALWSGLSLHPTNPVYGRKWKKRYWDEASQGYRWEDVDLNDYICDVLKGDYPKDFKWTGWHPHCRCHATSILKTDEEIDRDNERILNGLEPLPQSVNTVTEPPKQFNEWCADNEERILKSRMRGTEPYFLKDNRGMVDEAIGTFKP